MSSCQLIVTVLVQLTLIMQKNTHGGPLGTAPQNALQSTTVHCSALQCNVLVTGPQWL
jgi:hypothetical protein